MRKTKMWKKFTAFTMAMMLGVTVIGCGSNKTETAENSGESSKSEQLIIYTNSGSNGRDIWLQDRAKQEGYNIKVVQIQGGDLGNRLITEKNNPQADLVFGLNAVEYEKLKREDILQKWEPVWASEVDSSLADADGYYYPIVIQPLVNIMNADLQNPPKDYTDLIQEQWKDKYTLLNFGGGTGKTILASLLVRYQSADGEAGVSKEGWDFVKSWIQNGHMEKEGDDNVGNVIEGKHPICEMWGSGVIQNQQERNYKFQIMSPEIGVPYVTEEVAIINGTKKTDLAIDFANWFGSSDLQKEWMDQFGTIPCQPKALEMASDDIKEFMNKVKPQEIDWKFVSEHIDQWVEKCELEFIE